MHCWLSPQGDAFHPQILGKVGPDNMEMHATLLQIFFTMFARDGKVDNESDGARFMEEVRSMAGAACLILHRSLT